MSLSLPRDIGLHMREERSWHAESSYYYMSPTQHSTALGIQSKLHQLQDNQNQQLLRDWISFRLSSLTFFEGAHFSIVVMDDFLFLG